MLQNKNKLSKDFMPPLDSSSSDNASKGKNWGLAFKIICSWRANSVSKNSWFMNQSALGQ